MRFKLPILILLALTPVLSARAQTSGVLPADNRGKEEKRSPLLGSPEEEMLRRAEIKAAEDAHKEMVERAEEAAQLGDQIRASFEKLNALSREDIKKLERLEKLARKIRGAAGGSDDKERSDSIPDKLGSAISRVAELSGLLKKSVQKTSRLVISAAVIENTNELIELIQHLRQRVPQ
jgi:type I site-specific restriction endonuclease